MDRARWRRFRAEAIAGRHGADLAEPRWWRRTERAWLAGVLAVWTGGALAGLYSVEGASADLVLWSVLVCGPLLFAALALLVWQRTEYWGQRVQLRYRLGEFARVNGLVHEPEPQDVPRLAAHIFEAPSSRHRHLDRFTVPGRCGFVIANYRESSEDGSSGQESVEAGYVVFRLRRAYPHTLLARTSRPEVRRLRDVGPVEWPDGLRLWSTAPDDPPLRRLLESGVVDRVGELRRGARIEIVGRELFVLRREFWPVASPRLWEGLAPAAEALAPFLDAPAGDREQADTE
ncbi:hypothetical protein [Streptomyces sp. NPDC058045]|uniref:hypothetical protein n=1 Tax=Streptomyces sp. NPDC058045 TaxID=3346311 RepID=UPI0036E23599